MFVGWRTKKGHPLNRLAPWHQVGLRWTAEGSDLRNDLMLVMISNAPGSVNQGAWSTEAVGVGMLALLDLAVGSGELRLTSSDPDVQPFLDYRYLESKFDRRRMREMVRTAVTLADSQVFQGIIEERFCPTDAELASDEALDEWLLREATTSHHISGTCKMGPPPPPPPPPLIPTPWRWWTSTGGSEAWKGCALPMRQSCRIASGPIPT